VSGFLTRLSISIHAGMFIMPVGQFVMLIKSFGHFSELTIEDEDNRKPGRRRRWVASSVPTQINISTMRHKFIYLLIECIQYKLLECSL